ncbi:glycosyltransferase family 4 protein [Geobacter sp. FeAm09]|uniref:glycosyltransferase family 4 protein n=1 Tax=Geobacter sp. FeAm09 TaxID=2597769 RepID=UPI0011EE37EA|nr:glycosyltransferase family 4 protein [Geobacter sp. FeAm09]QEM66790.1 glycosyltransferase family 4 protein [Geobacter sp. FeAm09]
MDVTHNLKGTRILILLPHLVVPGGASSYALHLAGQLLERGATVGLLVMRIKRDSFALPAGIEVVSLGGPLTSSMFYWLLFPFWQARINRAISTWRAGVLVPQVFPSNWWAWLYKRNRPEAKLVWICHEPSAFIHSDAWIRALRPAWKSLVARVLKPVLAAIDVSLVNVCDRIVANSRFTAAEVERVYGLKVDGIAHPGVDFQDFTGSGWRKERALITVARLTKFKRIDFLLEVFRELLKTFPDLTFHIVGTGEEEAELQLLAKKLGVAQQVVFHGKIGESALASLYLRSTLFLHGSVDEPFGMAPLEAIACGTPVIAHNSGGPVEFVTAECGRLINSLSIADWAQSISEYLNFLFAHEDFPERVLECARNYDWRRSLAQATEVIAGLCTESTNPPP